MPDEFLNDDEKRYLLETARQCVICCTLETDAPTGEPPPGRLLEERGCFVCIKIGGVLRGCLGNFTSDKPLYRFVAEMATAAACRDPRFYPMKKGDLEDFSVEISVLTPLRKAESIEEIQVGTHGIFIEKNSFRGVLLPQVAVEYGWDRETFLSQTCLKAGLRSGDWKEGAAIYIFEAQVFSDR